MKNNILLSIIQNFKNKLIKLVYRKKNLTFSGSGEYLNIINLYKIKLKNKPIIVEVGSLDANDAIMIKKFFAEAKIYSFEANPNQIKIMKNNINESNVDIDVINSAVSCENGEIDFYYSGDDNPGASSIYKFSHNSDAIEHTDAHSEKLMHVKSIRLDEWMKNENLSSIDLLLIDTQGSELDVIKSLGSKINNVKKIILEGQYVQLYENTPLIDEINDFLVKNNFKLKSNNLKRIFNKLFNNFYYVNLNNEK